MKTNRKKAGIVAAAVSSALLVGGGALAFADNGTPAPGTSTTQTPEKDGIESDKDGNSKERGESTFTGTIKAPVESESEAADGSQEEKAQDEARTAALAELATVTEQEATKAATEMVPGTVSKIQLDDEDGFVVWEVEITGADGTRVKVLVDAGNSGNSAQEVEGSDEATIVGTIKASVESESEAADGSQEEKAQDEARTAALAELATVTEQEATKAATDMVPGTVSKIQLDDEDGFVVWEVDIAGADGTRAEVLVDAGNASILAQQSD